MKTIATAAVAIMMLGASAWAEEPKDQEQAATDKPIVLSEAELDRVTAGYELHERSFSIWTDHSASSSRGTYYGGGIYTITVTVYDGG